ncbi:MAG: hypothetical protein CVU65_14050 [Deltaproteobacteria bacterium HGW-Deltaproteobacteria-22]|jgi:outer membrane protein OmpA-like peptidoglycan-associated protein|nr:MAG: hypothetical protein CVU65_14050 [Deltaproteobacteria bacterium HGW-Deltaproteobacteria-22]
MKKQFFPFLTSLLILLILPFPASAQNVHDINIMNFKMSSDPQGLITSESAQKLNHLNWYMGGMFSYAYDPLSVSLNGDKIGSLVEHQVLMDLTFSIGLGKWFQLGIQMQAALYQTGDDAEDLGFANAGSLKANAFTDLRLIPKIVLIGGKGTGFGLAVIPIFSFPTASSNANAGEDGVMFEPRLVMDYRFGGGMLLVGNIGYRMREKRDVLNLRVDDEVVFSLGAELPLTARLSAVGEAFGAIGLKDSSADNDSGIDMEEVPAEGLLALRWRGDGGMIVTGGAGTRFWTGYGSPRARLFVSLGYSPPQKDTLPPMDSDEDGIPDDRDLCPTVPEDINGFEDQDGCPDAMKDTDKDGILDMNDKCVNDPEDINGFEDQDGCPDAMKDTDKDGVLDINDKCVTVPEDINGFEDQDGCPDGTRDTDNDGIPDATDKCVNDPEDKDNFEDNDGCPDADNDGDGFCDSNADVQGRLDKYAIVCHGSDKCPNEAETINGFEDQDGCPDKGEVKVILTKTHLKITETIYFAYKKSVILKKSLPVLDVVINVMKTHKQIKYVEVQGHSSAVGDSDDNVTLAEARAAAVKKYMISKGIAADRLGSQGYGETQPLADCTVLKDKARKSCNALNRRVEFSIKANCNTCK